MSQKEAIKKIKEYLLILKQAGIPIQKSFLYGSYARNDANEDSDIDVMLVSDIFDTTDDYIIAKPWRYTDQVDYRIEPYSISMKRLLNDDVTPLIEIVRREGLEIKI